MARLLVLMGSGETAPAMAAVHRRILARLGPPPVAGAIIDSPYAFQENAAEISARMVEWFARSTGVAMAVASVRGSDQGAAERDEAIERLRTADYIFSGPGSPSHALRLWRDTPVPRLLAERLATGGALTFASAAALAVGAWTVPVYEIYKVGQDPFWLPGLDLLGPLGLRVAVIPHYDNTEGGSHDTRFCYVGERRLRVLEAALPAGHFVLGIDSHTALLLDIDTGSASVQGRGGVTIRAAGRSRVLPRGSTTSLGEIPRMAADLAGGAGREAPGIRPERLDPRLAPARRQRPAAAPESQGPAGSLPTEREGPPATLPTEREGPPATLPPEREGPPATLPPELVDLLVDLRERARRDRDWALSDRVRDALAGFGIELRDHADGTERVTRPPARSPAVVSRCSGGPPRRRSR